MQCRPRVRRFSHWSKVRIIPRSNLEGGLVRGGESVTVLTAFLYVVVQTLLDVDFDLVNPTTGELLD